MTNVTISTNETVLQETDARILAMSYILYKIGKFKPLIFKTFFHHNEYFYFLYSL